MSVEVVESLKLPSLGFFSYKVANDDGREQREEHVSRNGSIATIR